MFEEPLASSSKDDPDKDLGIDYGENQITKDQDGSSSSNAPIKEKYQSEEKSKS